MIKKVVLVCLIITALTQKIAYSQLELDQSRLILDSNKQSAVSMVLRNPSNIPYLAQAWIEDGSGNKVTSPLAALPILQRIDPSEKKQVRITVMGEASQLPSDRESLLFFNVLGVPPKSNFETNTEITLVMQNSLKLFYRPKGIEQYGPMGWLEKIVISKNVNAISIQNPTPYHVVIYAFQSANSNKVIKKDVVLKPYSTENMTINLTNNFQVHVINDYGSSTSIEYKCQGTSCSSNVLKSY